MGHEDVGEPNDDGWFPSDLAKLLNQRDGAARLLEKLPLDYSGQSVAESTLIQGATSPHNIWETCGTTYLSSVNGCMKPLRFSKVSTNI